MDVSRLGKCIYQEISCSPQLIGETNIRENFSTKRKRFQKTLLQWGKVCRDETFTEQTSIQKTLSTIGTPKEVVFPQAVSKFLAYI
jgi:hypothetical protein